MLQSGYKQWEGKKTRVPNSCVGYLGQQNFEALVKIPPTEAVTIQRYRYHCTVELSQAVQSQAGESL
jgi:hypothetical protein